MRYQILIYEVQIHGQRKIVPGKLFFNPKDLIANDGSVIMASDFECLIEKYFSNDELKLFSLKQIIEISENFNYQVVEAAIVAEATKKIQNLNLYLIEYQTVEQRKLQAKQDSPMIYRYCVVKYKIEEDTDQFGFFTEAIEELPKIETYLTADSPILRELAKQIVKT